MFKIKIAIALSLITISTARADDPPPPAPTVFDLAPCDSKGYLSVSEDVDMNYGTTSVMKEPGCRPVRVHRVFAQVNCDATECCAYKIVVSPSGWPIVVLVCTTTGDHNCTPGFLWPEPPPPP